MTYASNKAPGTATHHAASPVQPKGASCAGMTKMPDPIIPPTTSAAAVQTPKGRETAERAGGVSLPLTG